MTSFFNFTRLLPIVYFYQVSASSDLDQKEKIKKLASLIMFLAKQSSINYLPMATMNDLYMSELLILKDYLYNFLKNDKVW